MINSAQFLWFVIVNIKFCRGIFILAQIGYFYLPPDNLKSF
jgi:hypothetical protein